MESSQNLALGEIFVSDFATRVISRFLRDTREGEIGEMFI
jgi:hypothetical protein